MARVGWGAEDDPDADGYGATTDCGPEDPATWPAAPEACDGLDNNCDGDIDEGPPADAPTWATDADGDGFGAGPEVRACDAPDGTAGVGVGVDCDDRDPSIHPGAQEVGGNDVDEDCDGQPVASGPLDDGCQTVTAPHSWLLVLAAFGLGRRRRGGTK